jgi:hypothetical protein
LAGTSTAETTLKNIEVLNHKINENEKFQAKGTSIMPVFSDNNTGLPANQ